MRVRALLLDRAHRARLRSLDSDAPLRDLAVGVPPVGVRRTEDGMDFAFIVPAVDGVPMMQAGADDTIWELYCELLLGGYRPPSRAIDVFFFGADPEQAARLVHLVACGAKRASAGWLRAAQHTGATVPTPGLVSVATDGFGLPRVVIQTIECRHVPMDEVDAELAASEGEGDLSLADWREGHLRYFTAEAARVGLAFDPREVLMVEIFRVLHIVGRADGA